MQTQQTDSPPTLVQRIAGVALGLSAVLMFAALAFGYPWPAVGYWAIDFHVFHAAAQTLIDGGNPYLFSDLAAHAPENAINDHMLYAYPPLFAQLLIPLAALPFDTASRVWLLMNLLAVTGSIVLMQRAAAWEVRPAVLTGLILGGLLYLPCLYAYLSGQASLWSLFWASVAVALSRRADHWGIGASWALAWVKPHPFLLIPFDLVFTRRRALIVLGAVMLVSLLAALPLLPDWIGTTLYTFQANRGGESVFYQAAALSMLKPLGMVGLALHAALILAGAAGIAALSRSGIEWKPRMVGVLTLSLLVAPYIARSDIALTLIPIVLLLSEWEQHRGAALLALLAWSVPLICVVLALLGWDWALLPVVWGGSVQWILAAASGWYLRRSWRNVSESHPVME